MRNRIDRSITPNVYYMWLGSRCCSWCFGFAPSSVLVAVAVVWSGGQAINTKICANNSRCREAVHVPVKCTPSGRNCVSVYTLTHTHPAEQKHNRRRRGNREQKNIHHRVVEAHHHHHHVNVYCTSTVSHTNYTARQRGRMFTAHVRVNVCAHNATAHMSGNTQYKCRRRRIGFWFPFAALQFYLRIRAKKSHSNTHDKFN